MVISKTHRILAVRVTEEQYNDFKKACDTEELKTQDSLMGYVNRKINQHKN